MVRDFDFVGATEVRAEEGRGEAARRLFELLAAAALGGKLRVVVTAEAMAEGEPAVFRVIFEAKETDGREGGGETWGKLSVCERDVARLVAQGCSNDEVARALGKSVMTVKKQLGAIYRKLGVPTRGRLGAMLRWRDEGGYSERVR